MYFTECNLFQWVWGKMVYQVKELWYLTNSTLLLRGPNTLLLIIKTVYLKAIHTRERQQIMSWQQIYNSSSTRFKLEIHSRWLSDRSVFLCTISIKHSYLQPIGNIFVLCFVLDDNSPGDYVTQLFKAVKTAVDIGNDTVDERSTTDRTVGTALDIGNDTVDERSTTDRTVDMSATKEGTTHMVNTPGQSPQLRARTRS